MRRLNYLEESSSMMYKQPDSRTMYQEACPVAVEIQRHDTGQSQGALAIQRHQVPAASQCYGSIPAMAVRSKCVSPRKLKPLETPEQFHELVKQLPGKFPRSLWAVISSFLFHPIFDIEERLIHLMKNSSGRELRLKKIKQLMAERSKYLQNCADISDFGSSIGTLSTPCQSITVTEMNNKLKNKKYLQHCPDRSNFGSSIGISSTPCQSITVTVPSEISFELKFCGHHQIVIYNPQGICVECLYENMDMRVNRNQREQRINDDSNKEGEPNFVVWISDSMSGSLCSFYQNDFDQQDLLDMGYPHQPAISTNLGLTTGEVVGADLQDKAISEDEEAVYNILGPAAEEYGMIIGTKEDNSNGRTSQGSERI